MKTESFISKRVGAKTNIFFRVLLNDIWKDRRLYIMLIPFLVWYILFAYRPLWGLQIAFKDFNIFSGIAGSEWVGFANFIGFFKSPYFLRTLYNTLNISIVNIIFGFPAPIILALMLNEVRNKKLKMMVQTVSYLPYFISIVIVCGMVTNFLAPSNGIVNILLKKVFGLEEGIYFLIQKQYFIPIFTIMNIWKDTGFSAVIYLAALMSIDTELYEACVIDGGGKLSQLFTVTLPGILPTIIVTLILRIGGILEVSYESIILLYQPVTFEVSDVISTFVYRTGLVEGNYSIAATAGLFNSVVALLLVWFSNYISKKYTENSLW